MRSITSDHHSRGEPSAGTARAATATTPAIDDFVPFFKAFCNRTRAGLVEQLLSGERCVCELTADGDASQPLVSHHLAILRDAGFVTTRSEGARTYYAIDWERFDASLGAFRDFVAERRAHPHPGPGC
jgi:ArsR family transcriptional regulator